MARPDRLETKQSSEPRLDKGKLSVIWVSWYYLQPLSIIVLQHYSFVFMDSAKYHLYTSGKRGQYFISTQKDKSLRLPTNNSARSWHTNVKYVTAEQIIYFIWMHSDSKLFIKERTREELSHNDAKEVTRWGEPTCSRGMLLTNSLRRPITEMWKVKKQIKLKLRQQTVRYIKICKLKYCNNYLVHFRGCINGPHDPN